MTKESQKMKVAAMLRYLVTTVFGGFAIGLISQMQFRNGAAYGIGVATGEVEKAVEEIERTSEEKES